MRTWHEAVAAVGDLVPGGVPVIGLALLFLTVLGATLWYYYPEWLPSSRRGRGGAAGGHSGRRWSWPGWAGLRGWWGRLGLRLRRFRLRWRWRLRWRRRRRDSTAPPATLPADQLPDLPAAALLLSADELAAQGRYKEAVRERLRAIVRDLIEQGRLDYRPGWTVTELAAVAGAAAPATAVALATASDIFSGIWYGHRPAGPADDAAMRDCADQVRAALAPTQVTT